MVAGAPDGPRTRADSLVCKPPAPLIRSLPQAALPGKVEREGRRRHREDRETKPGGHTGSRPIAFQA